MGALGRGATQPQGRNVWQAHRHLKGAAPRERGWLPAQHVAGGTGDIHHLPVTVATARGQEVGASERGSTHLRCFSRLARQRQGLACTPGIPIGFLQVMKCKLCRGAGPSWPAPRSLEPPWSPELTTPWLRATTTPLKATRTVHLGL